MGIDITEDYRRAATDFSISEGRSKVVLNNLNTVPHKFNLLVSLMIWLQEDVKKLTSAFILPSIKQLSPFLQAAHELVGCLLTFR